MKGLVDLCAVGKGVYVYIHDHLASLTVFGAHAEKGMRECKL